MSRLPVRPGLIELLERTAEGEFRSSEPLAPKTSIRVGGSAELFVRPTRPEALVKLLSLAKGEQVPVQVLGGGANVLVSDSGVPGIVVKLPSNLFPEEVDEAQGLLTLGAGAAIARLIFHMKARGWTGAEFLAGIPGSIGGALCMNAGTKMGECLSAVSAIELATVDGMGWVPRDKIVYSYRRTHVPEKSIVTRVRFALREGDPRASKEAMDADLSYRKKTQPLSLPSFGSVFQNPPGTFAGRLIEQVGLKGYAVGGAQISALHANWIVNLGGATAKDVSQLIALAQSRVRDATGMELVPEVRRMGNFQA